MVCRVFRSYAEMWALLQLAGKYTHDYKRCGQHATMYCRDMLWLLVYSHSGIQSREVIIMQAYTLYLPDKTIPCLCTSLVCLQSSLLRVFMIRHLKPILQIIILTTAILVSFFHSLVLENTTKCPRNFHLVHIIIPNFNWVTRILVHTLRWNLKSC